MIPSCIEGWRLNWVLHLEFGCIDIYDSRHRNGDGYTDTRAQRLLFLLFSDGRVVDSKRILSLHLPVPFQGTFYRVNFVQFSTLLHIFGRGFAINSCFRLFSILFLDQ